MRKSIMHNGRKVLGVVSAAAMAFTAFTGIGAAAADSNVIVENKTYDASYAYIGTYMASDYAGKGAVKVTYEFESLSTVDKFEVTNDDGTTKEVAVDYSDTFEFVAFDMNWGGWVPTSAGVANPVKGTEYSVTVDIATIEKSLGGATCQGFNVATGAIGDATVKLIKMEYVDAEQEAAGALFTGSWEKGVGGEFIRDEGTARISPNEWYIGISNLYVVGFKNPTIAVTVDYETAPNAYVQAEIQNGATGEAIVENYPYVDKAGTVTYTTQFSDDLTSLNVCYDACVVKEIRIYDDTEGDVPDASVTGKTAAQVAADMGIAWNLGNALESSDEQGNADETAWGTPRASKDLFRAVKAAGFNTVRIPVSYLNKINGDNTVDAAYLARVKQVVDYAYDMGMYVVIDMHNDGGTGISTKWLDISKTGADFDAIKTKFAAVWGNIATYFADYDQRLVFEGYNELMNADGNYGAAATTTEVANVNALAQAFVTAVRGTGDENNTDRVLIVAGYNTNIDETVKGFVKPKDTASNRLMLSVHYYDPYAFTLEESMNTTTWGDSAEVVTMQDQIMKISDFAQGLAMPVFIGEYGPIDKKNTEQRANYCYELNWISQFCDNVVAAYWDNGVTEVYGSALFNRSTNEVTSTGSDIIEGIKRGKAGL